MERVPYDGASDGRWQVVFDRDPSSTLGRRLMRGGAISGQGWTIVVPTNRVVARAAVARAAKHIVNLIPLIRGHTRS